ncbi:Hsp70 family protein [Agrobacterium vitis]|uniref:Hsp70 family protein n=1 Tax=Agrobacterium vitis TaxID=373 RepID=UPI00087312D6|nr:Hsp70 family protein [Agrobacterium vitis]MCE6074812.1 Hsp70 family protein [Agrobacterium vitis]MCM2467783.1 Hsp70 family protein [Agrobacterium vitis]MUO68312.1 Hsp70 family protein [Agrobacterium vitis]MUO83470.1 Hsp70 family protein [Agrobacterium vitis]MVA82036.1 Hsp70 family protein [Agrobacterium vitis]
MIVGIDLGTTHSLIGGYIDDKASLFPNVSGSTLTPSVVSVHDSGVIVGEGALDRLVTHTDDTVACFKRWMGTSRETMLGGRSFRPEELSSFVLRSLLDDAEAATGKRPDQAVISVPAYFSDAQRNATRLAGEMAGLKVERLINEPTAAALAYGLEQRDKDSRFLIFDLGGGTFDVSIVEIFSGVVEVHSSAGDNYLGGEDFLEVLFQAAAEDLGLDVKSMSKQELVQLRRRLDMMKRHLSSEDRVSSEFVVGGKSFSWSMDESRFSRLSDPLIQRLRLPLERALRDANITADELDEVVLVGGATRMPLVLRSVSRMLGRLPLRHIKPDEVVAHGAVVASGLHSRNTALEEIILTDVCPYTLGTEISRRDHTGQIHDGYFLPIIPRSSTVPVSREEEIWPVYEDQTLLLSKIYQGENPIAAKNVLLGELKISLPQHGAREERGILLRFTYDINGILQVEAIVKATGEKHEIILERAPGSLSQDEIKARLAALSDIKLHPRKKQENLAVLARLERFYEERLVDRDGLQHMMFAFKSVLESQDEKEITRVRKLILADLDQLERL